MSKKPSNNFSRSSNSWNFKSPYSENSTVSNFGPTSPVSNVGSSLATNYLAKPTAPPLNTYKESPNSILNSLPSPSKNSFVSNTNFEGKTREGDLILDLGILLKDKKDKIIPVKSEKKAETIKKIQNETKVEYKWRDFTENSLKLKNYQKSKALGTGSFGKVWVALKKQKELIALKEIICHSPDNTNLCISECVTAMKLDHPNILKYNDVFSSIEEEDASFKVFIEMEIYPLGDLAKFMKNHCTDEGMIIEFCKQILSGIEYIHSKKLIHRDLKPENILIKLNENQEFLLSICDFGATKSLLSMKVGSIAGTETYVAPEMMEKEDLCTEKIDIFSFGAILYYLLMMKERRFYFEVIKDENKLFDDIKHEIQSLKYKNKDVFLKIILMCLNKDPNKRPSSSFLKDMFNNKI